MSNFAFALCYKTHLAGVLVTCHCKAIMSDQYTVHKGFCAYKEFRDGHVSLRDLTRAAPPATIINFPPNITLPVPIVSFLSFSQYNKEYHSILLELQLSLSSFIIKR